VAIVVHDGGNSVDESDDRVQETAITLTIESASVDNANVGAHWNGDRVDDDGHSAVESLTPR
jgi:hypothetical protein